MLSSLESGHDQFIKAVKPTALQGLKDKNKAGMVENKKGNLCSKNKIESTCINIRQNRIFSV